MEGATGSNGRGGEREWREEFGDGFGDGGQGSAQVWAGLVDSGKQGEFPNLVPLVV